MSKIIGYGMVVLLFAAIFVAGVVTYGWRETLFGWGMILVMFAWIGCAAWFISRGN